MQGIAKLVSIISQSQNTSLLKEATWLCLNLCSAPSDMANELDNNLNIVHVLCTAYSLTSSKLKILNQ